MVLLCGHRAPPGRRKTVNDQVAKNPTPSGANVKDGARLTPADAFQE